MEHDLFGKLASTFPDHALAAGNRGIVNANASRRGTNGRRSAFDISRSEDRTELDRLQVSFAAANAPQAIESCPDILARTAGEQPVTDDNMGSEWRYSLGLE